MVIDGFSKYVWARPLKRKQAPVVAAAFEDIITNKGPVPNVLYTDKGKEFIAEEFQTMLQRYNIVHRICGAEAFHCPFVERVNRTLKEKLFQAMTANTTQRWLELFPKIVETYNKTIHSTTKMAPADITPANTLTAYQNTYFANGSVPSKTYKFKVGDYVRIAKAQDVFSRGYLPRFTWEIFQIAKLANDRGIKNPPAYVLRDLNGNIIEHALFYEPELSRVDPQLVHGPRAVFPIHQVLKRRTVDGKRELLVTWKGWPKDAAEWIPESQIQKGV